MRVRRVDSRDNAREDTWKNAGRNRECFVEKEEVTIWIRSGSKLTPLAVVLEGAEVGVSSGGGFRVLGTESFVSRLEAQLGRRLRALATGQGLLTCGPAYAMLHLRQFYAKRRKLRERQHL
ncbi:MAG: hypothetical protein KF886_03750 [Candidatus Hydrogenedentes bacterium]|nr:hypothetical protein [Candidatus Hydrogenedentota bacterium]